MRTTVKSNANGKAAPPESPGNARAGEAFATQMESVLKSLAMAEVAEEMGAKHAVWYTMRQIEQGETMRQWMMTKLIEQGFERQKLIQYLAGGALVLSITVAQGGGFDLTGNSGLLLKVSWLLFALPHVLAIFEHDASQAGGRRMVELLLEGGDVTQDAIARKFMRRENILSVASLSLLLVGLASLAGSLFIE